MPSQYTKRADGRYSTHIDIGRTPDGKRIRKTLYANSQNELKALVGEVQMQLKNGSYTHDASTTFKEWVESWLIVNKKQRSDRQAKSYKSRLTLHAIPALAQLKLKDIKPLHIQLILNNMAEQGYARKTIGDVRMAIRAVLNGAVDNDLIIRNAADRTSVPETEDEAERKPIPQETIDLITSTWLGHRMGIPVMIMLYGGLRRGELIALTWDKVDVDNRLIHVHQAAAYNGNQASLKKPKNKDIRDVPMPQLLYDAINQAKQQQRTELVSPAVKGGIMSDRAFRRAWESYQHYLNIKAGGKSASRSHPKIQAIERFTAHQLRHTYATMLYDAGVDVKTAQELLGHRTLAVTMSIYTHLSEKKKHQSIEALDKFLSNSSKKS